MEYYKSNNVITIVIIGNFTTSTVHISQILIFHTVGSAGIQIHIQANDHITVQDKKFSTINLFHGHFAGTSALKKDFTSSTIR